MTCKVLMWGGKKLKQLHNTTIVKHSHSSEPNNLSCPCLRPNACSRQQHVLPWLNAPKCDKQKTADFDRWQPTAPPSLVLILLLRSIKGRDCEMTGEPKVKQVTSQSKYSLVDRLLPKVDNCTPNFLLTTTNVN